MTDLTAVDVVDLNLDAMAEAGGRVVVFVTDEGQLSQAARRANRLCRGAVARLAESDAFAKMKSGEAAQITWPNGMAASVLQVVKLAKRASVDETRLAGAAIGKAKADKDVHIFAGNLRDQGELMLGVMLRDYAFTARKSGDQPSRGKAVLYASKPEEASEAVEGARALAEGVVFTRDLVTEPSNVLTTVEFAERLEGLRDLGVEVEVLEEQVLEALGMRTLLAVGQGSESPSKVVVMQWKGGGDENPFALIGKGVVFDTGGISLKPAGGMEDMTMDMGGAGVVSGVMKTLALRKAKANVVGLVGLVENMPDGRAQRPGDVVTSMKGDTVEVINTDAEGRLVLCDVMWYAQDRFKPTGMIDLATLTGAIIIGLGHDNAGVFSNDDTLCNAFLKAAQTEGEGAWRMPLGAGYDKLLKSDVADMKNIGGRPAGSITAAQFLQRFVKEGTPWIHLDIAGVASVTKETPMAPKGATGWGVLALNRLIAETYEG